MPDYGITTGLPQLPSALKDENFTLVLPLYQALNTLAQTLSSQSGLVDFSQSELGQRNQLASIVRQQHAKVYARAVGSALAYGKIVNLYLDSGKIAARYADATDNTKPAHGIVNQPQGIDASDYGEVVLMEGLSQGIAGTTFGAYYYLGTNGDVQLGRPITAGSIVQALGFGLGSAGFYLHISSYFHQN